MSEPAAPSVDDAHSNGAMAGKIVAVTGATSGSGRAVARRFVAEGATVAFLARGKERLMAETAPLGNRAVPVVADVSDPDSVRAAFGEIEERFGRLDVLVNNAAVYRPCLVADLSDHDIGRQVATNLLGPIYTCRAAVPLLRAAGGGDIVNTSSESTLDPFPMLSVYVATKSGLEAFTRTLMAEVGGDGIRITLIIQGAAIDGEGSTDWTWDPEKTEQALALWAERGFLAKASGRGPDSSSQTVDDVADVHVYAVTRPRGQRLDTIHVRSH